MSERSGLAAGVALRAAAEAVGLRLDGDHTAVGDHAHDVALVSPAGRPIAIEFKRMSLASVDGLARRIDEWSRRLPEDTIGVLVADRVTAEARQVLNEAGWGWLDLRGHLHVVGRGLFVDADVPAITEKLARHEPFTGQVGVEVAVALLLRPDRPATVRGLAKSLGRAPSSVSEVLSRLRHNGLLDSAGRPAIPDLFVRVADVWQPSQVDVLVAPTPGDNAVNTALHMGLDHVDDTTGWAIGDTVAAAAYGAPVGIRADHPPDFYVPDRAVFRRAEQLLGVARDHASRAATVRLAPVVTVCASRVAAVDQAWPLVQPLFVALDLAKDPGRGREILTGWTPDGWPRVW